jgi:hypothetical protein
MFDIYLTEESAPGLDPGVRAVQGKIRIGDYFETIITSLISWTPKQYERHWLTAVQRVVEGGDRSALITSYVEPAHGPDDYLVWWPLYREGETVHIQNHMLFFAQLTGPFSPELFWTSVRDRRTVDDEGLAISEWTTTVDSLSTFLDRKMSA